MAKINVTIPDDIRDILQELAKHGGQSLSEVAADCIKLGLVDFLEVRNKMEVYRSMLHKRLEREKAEAEKAEAETTENQTSEE
ncbi:MAG: hypothetical protein ACYTXF_35400 [Nostoc sp.]